jgi:hypothetical protein
VLAPPPNTAFGLGGVGMGGRLVAACFFTVFVTTVAASLVSLASVTMGLLASTCGGGVVLVLSVSVAASPGA